MGRLSAEDVAALGGDRRAALTWHLRVNHFPPHPHFMVDVAWDAIIAIENDDLGCRIDLPDEVSFREETFITAQDAVEALHLEPFLYPHHELDGYSEEWTEER